MIDGPSVARVFQELGITHVTWLPDSEIGTWEPSLLACPGLHLIRVCREGEAIAIAGGLMIGGKKPVAIMQCTGLFDAGDALRNIVHDLKLPLFCIVGVRSYYAHQQGTSRDSCPIFTEPIMKAWQIPYDLLGREHSAEDLATAYRRAQAEKRAGVVLLGE